MLGELRNIPTNTLLEMVVCILAGGNILTDDIAVELIQIEQELERRAEEWRWDA